MSRRKNNRKIMTRAARRELAARKSSWRVLWSRIGSVVSRGERWWRHAHEQDLTDREREEIGGVLHEFLADRISGEVAYTGDIEVAYHQGFLLTAAWLIFSGTEAYELADVLRRNRIVIHHDWWITDGWGEFHDKFGVKCGECGTYSYGRANDIYQEPRHVDWPESCHGCNADLPRQHHTHVFGSGDSWYAECSCGTWESAEMKGERYAKGAATRHLNRVTVQTRELVAV